MNTGATTAADRADAIKYTSHVFGRFGQGVGALATEADTKAYSNQAPANNAHGVMFSIFPDVITLDAGAAGGLQQG